MLAAAAWLCLGGSWSVAAEERAAVTTINHAFATELGTGLYDIGGQGIFVVRVSPSHTLRAPDAGRPGIRIVAPVAAGSFDFNPFAGIAAEVPDRIDSFSLMPGVEFDFPLDGDWTLTPWLRAGASFSAGQSDGLLFGAGARLAWSGELGGVQVDRLHELLLAPWTTTATSRPTASCACAMVWTCGARSCP